MISPKKRRTQPVAVVIYRNFPDKERQCAEPIGRNSYDPVKPTSEPNHKESPPERTCQGLTWLPGSTALYRACPVAHRGRSSWPARCVVEFPPPLLLLDRAVPLW